MESENGVGAYRHDLDLLKGLAVIAVVLYHAGFCKSGYLGVDVFLVISGYFIVPKVVGAIEAGTFNYISYLEKRLFRLLPLVLLVSAVALTIGYFWMLPGDYRYLCEETMAASVFADNILQAVTTQNYWAAIYHKILMHTWYLGVLFQFYIVFPILMLLMKKRMLLGLAVMSLLSLLLYLMPVDTIGNKYYLLQYRFFEMAVGGIIALKPLKAGPRLRIVSLTFILLLIFFGTFTLGERAMPYNLVGGTNTIRESFLPRELVLLLTAAFTVLFVSSHTPVSKFNTLALHSKVLAPLGRMSLSVYLWHQPLLAFYRYFYADELTLDALMVVALVTFILSLITYSLVERRLRINKVSRICLTVMFLTVNGFALQCFRQGGVVRDVPELDIRIGESDPAAFERYTDRIYQYDKEFTVDGKGRKVLIIGNSFARDFANMLLESPDSGSIQMSYHYDFIDCPMSRIQQCDRIYYFGWKHQVPDSLWQNLKPGAEIWGIGTKNHGSSNGIFYKNRYKPDYFNQRTTIHPDFYAVNRLLREEWQEHYIDLMSLTMQDDSTVAVFTPDHHFITYDGKHLTPAGTKYYARLLLSNIFF